MILEIVSPEATLFTGEVAAVSVPGTDGSFQMLNNHAPIVAALKEGAVAIKGQVTVADQYEALFRKEGDTTLLDITSGTVEMNANKVILLID
jgi:F-type H+-transporting ATPase subunit epsilon